MSSKELTFNLYCALAEVLAKVGVNDIPSVIDQLVGKNCGKYADMYNEYKNQKKELAWYKKLGLELAYERCPKCNKEMIYNSKYNFYRCCNCGLVIDGAMFDYFLQQAKEKINEKE